MSNQTTDNAFGTRVMKRLKWIWLNFWLAHSGLHPFGRLATRLAVWFVPPYKARCALARMCPAGYVAPSVALHCPDLKLGAHVFIGDRVVIYQHSGGGPVILGDRVELNNDCILEVDAGGSLSVGADTTIQPRCQITAAVAPIQIGCAVQIAANCAFYSYDHSMAKEQQIRSQPLQSKGPIVIEDDVWLGYGVIVLSGVRIGRGAVVGAGSVVTRDVPGGAVAVGVPARVIRMREDQGDGDRTPRPQTDGKSFASGRRTDLRDG